MLAVMLLAGCSVSKFIPEGSYLLDDVKIESDNKEIKSSQMNLYVRQTSNAKWFSIVKLPMYIYSASGLDSTKWLNRFWRKIGEAPVIYDREAARETREEMEKAVQNMGYMGATVDMDEVSSGNRMKVYYSIHSGQPYVVERLTYDISDSKIAAYLAEDSTHTRLYEGMRFDVNVLDEERQRITQYLQDRGYYRFNKDFVLGVDFAELSEDALRGLDSISSGGVGLFYKDRPFLRPRVVTDYNHLHPGDLYCSRNVQDTYSSLARLSVLKYSNIRFDEVRLPGDSARVDAYIFLSKNKNKALSFEIEGTNSAGDLGAAASASFIHRNLFKGSETFTLKLRGAYEAVSGLEGYANSNYVEYGVESSINFPEFMFPFLSSDFKRRVRATSEVSVKFNSQVRPEFERTLASAAWSYRWSRRGKATHRFDVLDINYVYMPYISGAFNDYLDRMDQVNPLLRHSYEDLFIVRMGYTYTYNSAGGNAMKAAKSNSYSIRFNIEESGNLLYGFSRLVHKKPKYGDAYQLANIDFAQYVKMDIDFAKNFVIDDRNSLVFHAGLGIACPYGNSRSLPFEKLYFSGGANSVRGWRVRTLGPGSYRGDGNTIDYVNHTGDIKLDLNIEYRTYLFWKLNGAAFIDAGNVWNIRTQGTQTEGVFKFNRFYKQLAVAYGLGIRFDLDFLILRFDGGMKAINPMYTGKDRYPIVSPDFKRDFAFHFAVGYPF